MPDSKRQKREVNGIPVEDGHLDPKTFFCEYVAKRNPVKFSSLINDESWKGDKWSNKYMRQKSGQVLLRVESRDSAHESFGRGNEKKMTFNSFIDSLEQEDETLFYLTTQELSYTHEGQPSLTSPPVDGLIGDFPWVPKLCGNLIPQNVNLWFGSSKRPTSSGLHHDFHDNLYLLLRGEKQITLFSPKEAASMYTVGEIVKIHPNGRINYKDQTTNADGSDEASLIALKASAELDTAAEFLTNADEEDMLLAEQRIEDALEAILDAEIAGNEDSGDEDGSEDKDEDEEYDENEGFEPLNLLRKIGTSSGTRRIEGAVSEEDGDSDGGEDQGDFEGVDDYVESDDDADADSGNIPKTAKNIPISAQKIPEAEKNIPIDSTGEESSSSHKSKISVTDPSNHSLAGVSTSVKSPPNFSAVDTSLPLDEIAKQYPLYYEALTNSRNGRKEDIRASVVISDSDSSNINSDIYGSTESNSSDQPRSYQVTLTAGQMLFIPAGWFHEVRSTGGGDSGHLALNYWFHPPDGSDFNKPYLSDFWPNDWRKRGLA